MSDQDRDLQILSALRGLYRSVEESHQLQPGEGVRLLSALLTERMVAARRSGVGHEDIDALMREGEEMALAAAAPLTPRELSAHQTPAPRPAVPPPPDEDEVELDFELGAFLTGGAGAEDTGSEAAGPETAASFELPATALLAEEELSIEVEAEGFEEAAPSRLYRELFGGEESGPVPLTEGAYRLVPDAEPGQALVDEVRRHPRYAAGQLVKLQVEGAQEMRRLVCRDLSEGGMFVETAQPPLLGARVTVWIDTGHGDLEVGATVRRTIDGVGAAAAGATAGAGLQFDELGSESMVRLRQLLGRLEQNTAPISSAGRRQAVEKATRLLHNIHASMLYEALDIDPGADDATLRTRVAELVAELQGQHPEVTAEEQQHLNNALRALHRIGELLGDPRRRLAYDFMRGLERVDERLAAAEREDDPSLLREVWARVFSSKIEVAQQLARQAIEAEQSGDLKRAGSLAAEALTYDPFNLELRKQGERWETLSTIHDELVAGVIDLKARLAWAKQRGVSLNDLRALWRRLFPARVEQAQALARRALQAESIKRREEALQAARAALKHDPFNNDLRHLVTRWSQGGGGR